MLSLPTFEVMDRLHRNKIIECGGGTGLWNRILREEGFDIISIDEKPITDFANDVLVGTHHDLSAYSDRLLLTVWPPDGTDLNVWVEAWGGINFAFVGEMDRVIMPRQFVERSRVLLPGGDKEISTFLMGVIDGDI